MTMIAPDPIVSVILARAADMIEGRSYHHFNGGPNTWTAIHAAVSDLVTDPVVEALRRHLGVDQVQFWNADQRGAVKEVRAVAGAATLDLTSCQEASVTDRLEGARSELCAALGYPTGVDCYLSQLTADIRDRLRRDEIEIKSLTAETERLRDALRKARAES